MLICTYHSYRASPYEILRLCQYGSNINYHDLRIHHLLNSYDLRCVIYPPYQPGHLQEYNSPRSSIYVCYRGSTPKAVLSNKKQKLPVMYTVHSAYMFLHVCTIHTFCTIQCRQIIFEKKELFDIS